MRYRPLLSFSLALAAVTLPVARAAHPMDVQIVPDTVRTVSKVVTSAGGQLTVQGADGTTYTLTVPEGALLGRETIRMTPVIRVDALPLHGGLIGAVHLEPKGLEFLEPLTLTITPRTKLDASQLRAFNSHALGQEFYLQPLRVSNGGVEMLLNHFSNPGVALATVADEDLLAPLVPTDPRDRLETDAARSKADATFMKGVYSDKVRPELTAAQMDDARLKSAIKLFLAWRNSVQSSGLDEVMKAQIFEGWSLIARGIEHAVNRASASCVQDRDLSRLTDLLGWITWVKRNPRLGPYFTGKLAAFEAKAENCATFELTFDSVLDEHTLELSDGDGPDPTNLTSHFEMGAKVTVKYSVAKGTLEGQGPMESRAYTTKGYSSWHSAASPPDCTASAGSIRNNPSPFIVGTAGEFVSALDLDSLLTDLTTGRQAVGVDLTFVPGTVIHRFRMACDGEAETDVDGVEAHTGWSVIIRKVLKLQDEIAEPWQAKDMVFLNGVAEHTWDHAYSGGSLLADPEDEDEDLFRQTLRGISRLTLRHTPQP
ncbi:hypothetical protein [Deinococcus humi]|uniref:Uncharacterized protein n=1 Tax=Deinococcus humi TaxID=662880 RepID=A0A7W8JW78_9DEIO|nr:hypothetical protein [Deinococcus humi]MBB5362799.1 hypothetical protein [Deinococcus humi]GGO26201.1 hypothetical protein GCM10008949_16790 [Deinococcus humi]